MSSFKQSGPINIQALNDAPKGPGLYVWYAKPSIGKADWDSDVVGGNDFAQSGFQNILNDFCRKCTGHPISVTASGNFSKKWLGSLNEEEEQYVIAKSNSEKVHESYQTATATNETRECLSSIIDTLFPLFYSPLYIGIAVDQSLRSRLKAHQASYLRCWDNYRTDREFIDRLENPKNFAERAIKMRFTPGELFCFTIEASCHDQRLTKDQEKILIFLSEWLLNRWSTPILGRR